jgi:ATP-binding protein involved in chromosome partitioning
VLGVVENMSIHICSKCGHEEHIFGDGGGQRMAEKQYEVPFLGSLPLDIRIREETDGGRPTVVAEPDSRIASCTVRSPAAPPPGCRLQARNYSHKFPKIVIQNT